MPVIRSPREGGSSTHRHAPRQGRPREVRVGEPASGNSGAQRRLLLSWAPEGLINGNTPLSRGALYVYRVTLCVISH